jgi:predicted signal transduction protein with EAL and GGDEF domain
MGRSLPARRLSARIEITETAITTDPAKAREVPVALHALGVELHRPVVRDEHVLAIG